MIVDGQLVIEPLGTDEEEAVTVTITEHSGTFTYDGTEKTVTGYDVSIDNDLYKVADFTFSGTAEVKGTNAGSYDMELKAADFANTNTNFANVQFVIVDGQLVITPSNNNEVVPQFDPQADETLDVVGKSITAKYDGKEHSVTFGASQEGSTVEYSTDGTTWTTASPARTDAGTTTFSVRITNPNYDTVTVDGWKLVITPRTVVLTSASGTKHFDGTPIRRNKAATHITVGGDGFVSGEGATYTITGTQTDVGQSKNTFTYTLNANTKASNYTITQTLGRLMVLPEEVPLELVPLGLIGSVSMIFNLDTGLTADGKKAEAFKETFKWIKENNERLGAFALINAGNVVADPKDEAAWKLIKDTLNSLDRKANELPYLTVAGRNDVNGDEMDYETYLKHDLNEANQRNRYNDGQIWYQLLDEQQMLLVGIGYQKIADPGTATQEELNAQEQWIQYVNNVVSSYPEHTTVLLVNDFIEKDPDGRADEGRLTAFGELVEDRIVRINENVALILCGNAEGAARWEKTYADHKASALLSNYGFDEENGLGFFRIVTLNGEAHTITVTTYSPLLDRDSYDEDHPEYDFFVIEDAF